MRTDPLRVAAFVVVLLWAAGLALTRDRWHLRFEPLPLVTVVVAALVVWYAWRRTR